MSRIELNFWSGKKVLVTGHTGFKGTWLTMWLMDLGATVSGISHPDSCEQTISKDLSLKLNGKEFYFDISNRNRVTTTINSLSPDIVFHLAAQASVLKGYEDPDLTWKTNFIGSLNVLEGIKTLTTKVACIYVTTDKVYFNDNSGKSFTEIDPLGGTDPYSASKVMAEQLLLQYQKDFFNDMPNVRICAARAGNVIGGGDWLYDRLLPDIFRAVRDSEVLKVRHPESIRPWQHVLDPLFGYLKLAETMFLTNGENTVTAMNFGNSGMSLTVREMIQTISEKMFFRFEEIETHSSSQIEKGILLLNSSLAQKEIDWSPRISQLSAINLSIDWYSRFLNGEPMQEFTLSQIRNYLK